MDPGVPASRWSAASVTWSLNAYGHWLSWLKRTGLFDPNAPAAAAVCREHVALYVADMRKVNASSTVADRIQKLHLMAKALCPQKDWEWLRAAWRRLHRDSSSARDKRSRFVDAVELYRFGLELMKRGDRASSSDPMGGAILYRDGLMIALLISRPIMRRTNLAQLRIGEHLTKTGEQFWLEFMASEMKQRRLAQVPVPRELTANLDRYLAHHRPLLFPRNRNSKQPVTRDPTLCSHLWVAINGTGMSEGTIYARLVKLTREKFGKGVNTHLFRDIAATSIAIHDPKHVRSSMAVLGHSRFETTEQHYILASSLEASKRHQETILALRGHSQQADGLGGVRGSK